MQANFFTALKKSLHCRGLYMPICAVQLSNNSPTTQSVCKSFWNNYFFLMLLFCHRVLAVSNICPAPLRSSRAPARRSCQHLQALGHCSFLSLCPKETGGEMLAPSSFHPTCDFEGSASQRACLGFGSWSGEIQGKLKVILRRDQRCCMSSFGKLAWRKLGFTTAE